MQARDLPHTTSISYPSHGGRFGYMTGTAEKDRCIPFPIRTCRSRVSSALLTILVVAISISLSAVPAVAQPSTVIGTNVQKLANGVLVLMGYSLVPDVTTGSLSFANAETGDPGFSMSSLGAGFELDTGEYTWLTSRWRVVGRYKFGDNVQGWSVGLACSF
jgi:hypothetical protein